MHATAEIRSVVIRSIGLPVMDVCGSWGRWTSPSWTSAAGRCGPVVVICRVKKRRTKVRSVRDLAALAGTITPPTGVPVPDGLSSLSSSRSCSQSRVSAMLSGWLGSLGLKNPLSPTPGGLWIAWDDDRFCCLRRVFHHLGRHLLHRHVAIGVHHTNYGPPRVRDHVLVIVGRRRPNVKKPARSRRPVAAPTFPLMTIEGAGHVPQLDTPAHVADIILTTPTAPR